MDDCLVIGANYFIRTDTDHWVGQLVSVDGPYTLTLTNFAWIADSGSLGIFLTQGNAPDMEVEAAPDDMKIMLNWRAVITWPHPLFRTSV